MGKSEEEPTAREPSAKEPSQKVEKRQPHHENESFLRQRDKLRMVACFAVLAFPPTRRLMNFIGDAAFTQPGLTEPFTHLETVSAYLRNVAAERTFWQLFKQAQATFTRMTNHVLDKDIELVVKLDNIKCIIFENTPRSLAWTLQLTEPRTTKTMLWRPDIGATKEELTVDRDISRSFLGDGRTIFTIDSSADWNSMGFSAENIGLPPALTAVIGAVGVTGLLLFGKEIAQYIAGKNPKDKEVVAAYTKLFVLAVASVVVGKSELDEKTEGATLVALMGDLNSWISEKYEGAKSENGFIGFEAYLTLFRNTVMTQNIKRIVAIYGGFPEFRKQFIGAGGGHAEIWHYIHTDMPGQNEGRIREFAIRLMNATWDTVVISQAGNHQLNPRQIAYSFSKYCELFGDFQMAGNNMLPDGFISSLQLGVYQPSIKDTRLIPVSPRVILVEELRQKLVNAVRTGANYESETLSNLAMMVFKQAYDEHAVLQDQAAYWGNSREGIITPFDNANVQKIGGILLSKYEIGYLANALLYADQTISTGTVSEVFLQDTVVSTINGNIVLGASIHNGTVIPLIRRFSPTLKNAGNINNAVIMTRPDVIVAQDGFVLPGGVFIPIAPELVYRKVPPDYPQVESNQTHCTLHMLYTGDQKIEVIRSKQRWPPSDSSSLYVREGADRETQLNMDELMIC